MSLEKPQNHPYPSLNKTLKVYFIATGIIANTLLVVAMVTASSHPTSTTPTVVQTTPQPTTVIEHQPSTSPLPSITPCPNAQTGTYPNCVAEQRNIQSMRCNNYGGKYTNCNVTYSDSTSQTLSCFSYSNNYSNCS